jgi:hypothetical protein
MEKNAKDLNILFQTNNKAKKELNPQFIEKSSPSNNIISKTVCNTKCLEPVYAVSITNIHS